MDVQSLDDSVRSAERWNNYVWSSPVATSDHLWGWRRILKESFNFEPYYLAAVENDDIIGILPLFRILRRPGRYALSSIPFGNYGGILADNEETATFLLESAKELLHISGGEYLELRHRSGIQDENLQRKNLYSRFTLQLSGDSERHFTEIGRSNRNKINKSKRRGLSVTRSKDMSALYPIHVHTARRLGTPCFPRRYFELILETFSEKIEIVYVLLDGKPIAYDVVLEFKDSLVCQFNGALENHLHHYPNYLLIWSIIEAGCVGGFKEFDYCRSRKGSGTALFKSRLHMKEELLAYQYYVPHSDAVPERHPSNPKYQRLISLWKRLPLELTEYIGPLLVRYLA